ncbi:MAG: PD-(D/E)XK nuclease family protein [Aggregatilineales bacterium]
MAASVLLAPPGAGKTEVALQRVAQTARAHPFARIWVLVSSARQKDSFRERLAARAGPGGVFFNVEFFTFYELYPRLLKIAGQPARRLSDAACAALLRAVLRTLSAEGALAVYNQIAETPGFVRIVADFIYELKQNRLAPEAFVRAAQESGRAKDRDLARIYAEYQARLVAHNLVDRDGEGWLALSALETEAVALTLDLLVVDGYDEFTPLQARLLLRLSALARHTFIALATAPGREDTAGRRFARALAELQAAAAEQSVQLAVETRHDATPQQHPALTHITARVFQPAAAPLRARDAVALIEAPDPACEAAAVLRRVKRLLLAGCRPDDILIALRDWPRYADHFGALSVAYGIPLALHFSDTLARSPAVAALLQALDLPANRFRRRDLLDTLRSPYFAIPGLDAAAVDRLERISLAQAVIGGREEWLAAVARAVYEPPFGDDSQTQALLTEAEAQALTAALSAFFDGVTPPARASVAAYVRWLDALIGQDEDPDANDTAAPAGYTLNMPGQARREAAPEIAARDLAALDQLKRALRGLLEAQALLGALAGPDDVDAERFLDELRALIAGTSIERGPSRAGQVLVTTVTDARGLPHRHVFIPGLSEGIFPPALAEDPLYLDTERQALSAAGVRLETAAERAADEGLFLQLIGQASQTLTLSRPTVQDGAPWVASHLWRAVTQTLADADEIVRACRVPLNAVAGPNEAASLAEAALAAANGLNAPTLAPDAAALYNWLRAAQPAFWSRINRARQAELSRMSRQPHDRYSGRLRNPCLIARAAAVVGPGRVWSASQFNDLGACGFRFFAKRLLRLQALEEPEDALDASALGTINHAVLEAAYRQIRQRGLEIAPENLDAALAALHAAAGPLLDAAPQDYRFPADARWEQERAALLRRLEALVRQDFSDSSPVRAVSAAPRRPYLLETALAVHNRSAAINVEVDGAPEDLRVAGYIDRMDAVDDGVIVIDYKSGSKAIPVSEMRAGRNFQMMVYLLAAQRVLEAQPGADVPRRVLGGLFWHISARKASGNMRLDNPDSAAALDEARAHLGRYISAARRGDYSVAPRKLENGRCAAYCEFAQLCRVSSVNRYKRGAD